MNSQKGSAAQHYLNPLHVYCRLRDLGLPSPVARTISSSYERILYRRAAGRNVKTSR
ncbi:MAG: hypothetical protein Q8S17_05920 [Humidesulfovibrio sp.]|nr:hypothetical protein [Humidesulfovibrio sp.]